MTKLKFRSWTEQGVFSASNSTIHDIDDTAMGFRLLRLHGYQVSAGKLASQKSFFFNFLKSLINFSSFSQKGWLTTYSTTEDPKYGNL